MSAKDFAIEHNKKYYNYFEAIISKDGSIEYAVPSHLYKIIEMCYGVSYEDMVNRVGRSDDIWDMIPHEADPCSWMIEDKGVISCWYDYLIIPDSITKAQLNTLKTLVKEGCICSNLKVKVSVEKSVINLINSMDYDIIDIVRDKEEEKAKEIEDILRNVS